MKHKEETLFKYWLRKTLLKPFSTEFIISELIWRDNVKIKMIRDPLDIEIIILDPVKNQKTISKYTGPINILLIKKPKEKP